MKMNKKGIALLTLGFALSACGSDDDGSANLTVSITREAAVTDGMAAGDTGATIRDGWNLNFSKYLVTVGDIDLSLATDANTTAEDADAYVVDLRQVPLTGGSALWSFENLAEGTWNFSYSLPGGAHDVQQGTGVSDDDFNQMVADDLTYRIVGTITKTGGLSCPPNSLVDATAAAAHTSTSDDSYGNHCYAAPTVTFNLDVQAETTFGPCELEDGAEGVTLADGNNSTALTLHVDHLVFNGFPEGDESGVARYAQWIANSDLNLDGTVTMAELAKIQVSQMAELDTRYQLGGSPITLTTMASYVTAQLKTQGHFNGEGECPIDGTAHEHSHGDE